MKHRNFDAHVRNMMRPALFDALQLMGETSQDYMRTVQLEYQNADEIDDCGLSYAQPTETLYDSAVPELPIGNVLRCSLVRLIL